MEVILAVDARVQDPTRPVVCMHQKPYQLIWLHLLRGGQSCSLTPSTTSGSRGREEPHHRLAYFARANEYIPYAPIPAATALST